MASLLVIAASPRGDESVSHNLQTAFQKIWKECSPDSRILYRNLNESPLPYVQATWLSAYFTPPEQHTTQMTKELSLSNELTNELMAANHLVISTPVYNYNVPAVLKSWIDNVVRKGMTLGYDGKGLIQNKKATILLASGGDYTDGSPIQERNIAHQYLIMILKVLGFEDVVLISAGNAKKVDMGEISMDDFVDSLLPKLRDRIENAIVD